MHLSHRNRFVSCCVLFLLILATAGPVWAQSAPLGRGLEQIVQLWESGSPRLPDVLKQHVSAPPGEIVVHVRLTPGTKADEVIKRLAQHGFRLIAVSLLNPSLMDGYLPLSSVRAAAGIAGIKSMHAVQRPVRVKMKAGSVNPQAAMVDCSTLFTVGSVPAEAACLENAQNAQARGLDGKGIKIGALSDSFDTCVDISVDPIFGCITHAAQDVASGDLPAGIVVLEDLTAALGGPGTDEGRAILQLVHKIAPASALGFATAFVSEVDFSNNILNLRRQFNADVVLDDVFYFDEPMYSDGLLAQTVDEVVKEGAAYYSSAGNNGLEAYEDQYRPISFDRAQKLAAEGKSNVHLDELVAFLNSANIPTPVSVQSFGDRNEGLSITQSFVSFAPNAISFQWDEPFFVGKVRTNFDIFVFDQNGHFLNPNGSATFPGSYTIDDNTLTDEALQILFLPVNPNSAVVAGGLTSTTYQFLIANMNDGPARRIKYITLNGLGESQRQNAPSVFGHAAARNGQGVGAMFWGITNFPEDFSSPGPVSILFDNAGNRLDDAEVRNVPQITAGDGASTTFFGSFFGTSAAAPDAGAVAALVLQNAGGPGSLSPHEVYRRLQTTATAVPLSENRAISAATAGPVLATAQGDFTRYGQYFRLAAGHLGRRTVKSVSINVTNTPTHMHFNPNPKRFHVGTTEGIDPSAISASYSADVKTVTLSFKPGTFGSDDSFNFGLSVFNPLEGTTGEDADRMEGAVVTVTLDDDSTETATFHVAPKLPINRFTGFGLVNADLATQNNN